MIFPQIYFFLNEFCKDWDLRLNLASYCLRSPTNQCLWQAFTQMQVEWLGVIKFCPIDMVTFYTCCLLLLTKACKVVESCPPCVF